jgi:hypothetical protein
VGIPVKQILGYKYPHRSFVIHKASAFAKSSRKPVKDIHSRDEPCCQPFIGIHRFGKRGNLVAKNSDDRFGRIAGVKGGKYGMRSEVFFGALLVGIESGIEDGIEVRR